MRVRRTRRERGDREGETTLGRTFVFSDGITASAVAEALRTAPLVGDGSIFGGRLGSEVALGDRGHATRDLCGFSQAPGFRFDVDLAEPSGECGGTDRDVPVLVASFSQPDRATPYLAGDAVWFVSDGLEGARLDEEINTERAAVGPQPLAGARPSLRRWLFFRVGHAKVMAEVAERIARLARGPAG